MSYVPFEIVLETQRKLEETFISNPTYQNNQDLLLLSLYSLIPIERDEVKLFELKFKGSLEKLDEFEKEWSNFKTTTSATMNAS
jgi:hypothetical protein